MSRRLSAFALAAGLVAAQFGCNSCGDRPGLFSSRARCDTSGQPVGRGCGCFDAMTGQPVPCPPDVPATLVPGGSPYPYPIPIPGGGLPPPTVELPMPGPADRIGPPAVPFPAPGDASLPFPIAPGVPVKVGPNK